MKKIEAGFKDTSAVKGSAILTVLGPTVSVDIGYDPNYDITNGKPPITGVQGSMALIDTGASESCIDNVVATALKLPVIDRKQIAGSAGAHTTNIYQAQIHIPLLDYTIWGSFAGVDLIAGGQQHQALIGRTFLQNFHMDYDGPTGKVTLTHL